MYKGTMLYQKAWQYRQYRSGFTIVEVLVVILLIGLLAVFMVPRYLKKAEQSKVIIAKAQLATIEQDLAGFMFDCGRYPTQAEGLDALQVAPSSLVGKWKGPYGKKNDIIDPWGNKFVYRNPGQKNPNGFDLFSYGADGQEGGQGNNADIYND